MSQKIRIKLKSYDHKLVDKSAEKIVKAVKATGAIISGPIPLPTHKRIYTVNFEDTPISSDAVIYDSVVFFIPSKKQRLFRHR